MRRTPALVFVLLALLAPVAAVASSAVVEDGTLSVNNGVGVVQIRANGVVLGRVGKGSVQISDITSGDGDPPQITCDAKRDISELTPDVDDTVLLCAGEDVRFRLVGGAFRLYVKGRGINLSVVGKGRVVLQAKADVLNPGSYAFNDDDPLPLPDERTVSDLNAATTTP